MGVRPIGGTGGHWGLSSEGEWEKVRSERYGIEGRSCRALKLIKRTLDFILGMIGNL